MRVFSGIKPTGDATFGNYSGGFRQYVATQEQGDAFFCIVDLHAITVDYDPVDLRNLSYDLFSWLIATGLDPDRSTIFAQSHVTAHPEAAWLLGAVTSYGQLGRMTQFKEKSDAKGFVSAALFNYPILMAGDILLYSADSVPIGDDQRQHLELARDIAERFNTRFGQTFVVPEGIYPTIGARIMDLQDPLGKMGKTGSSEHGTIRMLDEPDVIRRKLKTAVTDSGSEVRRGRRQAGHHEPDRHLLGRDRRDAGAGREPLRRRRLRAVQGGRRRGGDRRARADPGALPRAPRRRERAPPPARARCREGPRRLRPAARADVRAHGLHPAVATPSPDRDTARAGAS